METTTTSTPDGDAGAQSTEPVQATQTQAQPAQPPEGQAAPQEPPTQATEPSSDDNLEWLKGKGLDPKSPEFASKVADMYRNAESRMHQATTQKSELEKSLNTQQQPAQPGADPVMSEFIQDYRRDKMINGFKQSHEDWKEVEPAMAKLLNQPVQTAQGAVDRSQLVNAGVMSLEDVYMMAKGSSPVDTEQIQTQARQEVLQTLNNTVRAGGGAANAANPSPKKPEVDPVTEAIRRSRGESS